MTFHELAIGDRFTVVNWPAYVYTKVSETDVQCDGFPIRHYANFDPDFEVVKEPH